MNYFEFRDKYLYLLNKLRETTNQIYKYLLNDLDNSSKDELYDRLLVLNLIEYTQDKIDELKDFLREAASIPYDVGMLRIVKALCKINCYLYSINVRAGACVPEYVKNFKIIYHIYIEESKNLFNKLGYIEATFLVITSDKLLWERQAEDFFKIKNKSLEQADNLLSKKFG